MPGPRARRHSAASMLLLLCATVLFTSPPMGADAAPRPGPSDPTHWNLQLPTGRPGHPDTLRAGQIARADQYGVQWTRDGIQLTANAGGVTTPGSHHARSEFGERKGDSIPDGGWNNSDGKTHRMDLITTVTRLPEKKPAITIMQIKDQGSNAANLGIQVTPRSKRGTLKDGLVVSVRVYGGSKAQVIDSDYKLGQAIHLVITTKNRWLTIDYNGKRVIDTKYRIDHASFKAGTYVQFSSSADGLPKNAEATVVISKLVVTHK